MTLSDEKVQLVVNALQLGRTRKEIVGWLGVTASTVARIARTERLVGNRVICSGRRPQITAVEVQEVIDFMLGPGAFLSWTQVTEHFGNAWSHDAMSKRVRDRGFIKKSAARKFELNQRLILTRYAWAVSVSETHPRIGFWRSVWFIDEVSFEVLPAEQYRKVLAPINSNQHQRPYKRLVGRTEKIHCLVAISYPDRVKYAFVNGTLDIAEYARILDNLFPVGDRQNVILVQDQAPAHTGLERRQFLRNPR
ncbi:hypothetical protein Ciccas_014578, partial [Cichlidogyrus casuarinus]